MKKLNIEAFKVFSESTEIIIDKKNILLYGENGSGKSSIFEAIKIIFLRDLIESRKISSTTTPENAEQIKNDLYSSYNNSTTANPFKLIINDFDYLNFNSNNYQVFMISPEMLSTGDSISLRNILTSAWFHIDHDIDNFMSEWSEIIAEEVTEQMNQLFKENIEIRFDDNYKCIVSDTLINLTRKEELSFYFNEAKLHLIKLLIIFNIIQINIDPSSNKKKIIVLDDFITSLDAANRTFLMRHIMKCFSNFQKIILTHNISFYNLVRYIICQINQEHSIWDFSSLYTKGTSVCICQQSLDKTVKVIKQDYDIAVSSIEFEQIGNKIRKKFELLLYELSKLLQIGTFEESKNIIELLSLNKSIYFNSSGKTVNDLIEEIKITLNSNNTINLKKRLDVKIQEYEKTDFVNLKTIIKDLTLYQKVTMHPMSHGTIGATAFTQKEIKESLVLLEKLENCILKFQNKNVTNI